MSAPVRAQVRVAPMAVDDITRVMEIDTLSFPLPWSPTSYRYELTQNPNSHFVVAVTGGAPDPIAPKEPDSLVDRLNPSHWFRPAPPPPPARQVVGYGGFWFIVDEAHISTIAVHPDWRGQGVGRRLFQHAIDDLGATEVDFCAWSGQRELPRNIFLRLVDIITEEEVRNIRGNRARR